MRLTFLCTVPVRNIQLVENPPRCDLSLNNFNEIHYTNHQITLWEETGDTHLRTFVTQKLARARARTHTHTHTEG